MMRNPVPVRRLVLRAALLVAVTLAAIVVLGDAGSPLSRWTRLDLGFLTVPAVLCGVLLSLSSIVLLLRSTNLAEHIVWQRLRDGEGPVRVLRLADVLPVTQRMLAGMGWAVLGLGLLSSKCNLRTPLGAQRHLHGTLSRWLRPAGEMGHRPPSPVHRCTSVCGSPSNGRCSRGISTGPSSGLRRRLHPADR